MAHETTKQMLRRSADHRFATRWLVGDGIDIGCGEDPLSRLRHFLPLMRGLRPWDLPDGDAMLMAGVPDASFDFVHSSHCLEHLRDPVTALGHWIRICRPGGHLVVTVPDEDLYEQGQWPSAYNADHKWTFTIYKSRSWSPRSINLMNLLATFDDQVEILKIEKLDAGFDYTLAPQDQTRGGLAESALEFVLRRKPRPQDRARPDTTEGQGHAVAPAAHPGEGAGLVDREAQARALLERGQAQAAREAFARLLADHPGERAAIEGLCAALEALGDFEAALALLRSHGNHLGPRQDVLLHQARLLEHLRRTDEVLAHVQQALALDPALPMAHALAGFQHLRRGDYRRGAQGLAWLYRSRIPGSQIGLFVDEQGRPRRLDGRTVVLSADAGLGDTLMFVRYAQTLKAQGARVVVECQPELLTLLSDQPCIDAACALGALAQGFDHRVPMHNLIGAFASELHSLPARLPYLRAPAEAAQQFAQRLSRLPGLKVGLVWSGNPAHPRNAARSIRTAQLAPLLATPGVSFVSLQKGGEAAPDGVIDWTAELHDMARTAALVQSLDLVVTIDSAVAHLAGTLGREVWLLNRFDGCWRWMDERHDSPWYPGILTQYRQARAGDWSGPIAAAARALAARAAGGEGQPGERPPAAAQQVL